MKLGFVHGQTTRSAAHTETACSRNPELVNPGMILIIMYHGNGLDQTDLVERVDGGLLRTIEGSTDTSRTSLAERAPGDLPLKEGLHA